MPTFMRGLCLTNRWLGGESARVRVAAPLDRNPSPWGPPHLLPGSSVSRKPLRVCNGTAPKVRPVLEVDSADGRRPRGAPHAPRRLGRLGHPLEPRPRAGHRAPGQGLLGVRPARHGLRPARRPGPRRARPIYHWTELIQSSPLAVERSVHAAIGGAYRSQRITTLELRFNPMKRNRGGERDLDHIIMAAIRGLDRASLEYPQVRAGLILMMDRTFTPRAERGHRREGDPLGTPRRRRHRHRRPPARAARATTTAQIAPHVEEARGAGLGVTIHVGEEGGDVGRRRDRRGRRGPAPRPDRPRDPRRRRRGTDGASCATPGSCSRSARPRTC